MTTSSFLRLADGGEVRFDFTPFTGVGPSSLAYQQFAGDGHEVGPEVTLASDGPGVDGFTQVDNFNAAALTGGGFVVAYEERAVFASGLVPPMELLTVKAHTDHGDSMIRMVIGHDIAPGTEISTPGVFAISGDTIALVFERRDEGVSSEHLVLPGSAIDLNDPAAIDLTLPAVPNFVSTAGGNLTLGFADGSRVLAGGADAGVLTGGAGSDTLIAGRGGDVIGGGDGNDSVQGGGGFDNINGNKGDDTIDGGTGGDDWLVGGQGNDLIVAHAGGNILLGNLGNDTLQGGIGAEILRGGQGDDLIAGGLGNDWLSGDRGSDTLTGGAGADTFHSFVDAGLDVITDFNAAEGDRILLDPGTIFSEVQVGADVVIHLTGPADGDGEIILRNVTLSDLPPGHIFIG